jgi:Tfp pilus assembly protein PilO
MNRMNGLVGVVASSLAVLVVVAAGWFFFVSPQRSKAERLGVQVDAAHSELMTDEQLIAAAKRQNTLGNAKAAERALPDKPKVSGVLRELNGFAAQSRTELDNITPGTALQVGNAQALPITLTFKGRYFGLQKLLKLMRQNAGVAGSTIVSKGRLYTVDSIQFAGAAAATAQNGNTSGSTGDIQATITLNAFVYNAVAPTATSTGTDSTTATAAAPTG